MVPEWDKVGYKIMLIGEYRHTVDSKKRISLPSKFRSEVGEQVVLTRGLDNCIFVYPVDAWKEISQKLSELSIGQADSRGFNRFMLAGAVEANIDGSGRILIPDFLKEFADIDDSVVLAGVHNRIEIWNEERWDDYKDSIESKADVLAEKLGDIGML